MKDIARFKKLFKIKTPCDEHFDYYISVLSRTYKHSNLPELIKLYEEAEDEYDDFTKFSHKKSDEIIDYLKSTITNQNINASSSIEMVDYNKKPFKAEINKKYLSIDLVQANWQVFKSYDETNELPDTYEELLDIFGCPEVLKRSKNYRQMIFGNLNTKRQQKIQASIMSDVKFAIMAKGFKYELNDIKHDEMIISGYDDSIYDYFKKMPYKFRLTEFVPTMVDNIRIYDFLELGTDKVLYKDFFSAPGNQLYMNIKKYILNEPVELRDLYFRENNRLAIWADDIELLKSLV